MNIFSSLQEKGKGRNVKNESTIKIRMFLFIETCIEFKIAAKEFLKSLEYSRGYTETNVSLRTRKRMEVIKYTVVIVLLEKGFRCLFS